MKSAAKNPLRWQFWTAVERLAARVARYADRKTIEHCGCFACEVRASLLKPEFVERVMQAIRSEQPSGKPTKVVH